MGTARAAAIAMLLGAAAAHARVPEPGASLDWFGGMNDGRVHAAGIHVRLPPREISARGSLVFYSEAQLQRWQARVAGGERAHAWVAGIMGFARYAPEFCSRCFVDAGIGAFGIDDRAALSSRPTGSNFTFAEQIGAGIYLDRQQRSELRIGWAHFSNAGVRRPNPGYDFIQVHARLSF